MNHIPNMQNMRSLICQGKDKTSFTITLPKSWIDSQGLTKNDSVWVEVQEDGSLRVSKA
jgi:antitoxin component of MazEF toxin-antitoxin module